MRNFLVDICQDARFAWRTLRKNPGFACAAMLTLAISIGANTAIYAVVDGVVLHPLPFSEPDRLVAIYQKGERSEKNSVPYLNLLEWQAQSNVFEAIAGWRTDGMTLARHGEPEALSALMISANFFDMLKIRPIIGRPFTREEDQRGAARVVMLGEEFWKTHFGADPRIVGQIVVLDGKDYVVTGVVPATVRFGWNNTPSKDVFTPIGQYDVFEFYSHGTGNGTIALGRLKPGSTIAQAGAEMDSIMRALEEAHPNELRGVHAQLIPLKEDLAGNARPTVLALAVAVAFVLLIACTNVANLALAQSMNRSEEFGLRVALGARRGRIVRQIMTESVLLSLAGGAAGMLIAWWLTGLALSVLPAALPAISDIALNTRVLFFSVVASIFTGVLFGIVPAVKAGRSQLHESLKQGGRGSFRSRHRLQGVLVVTEVALTLTLLAGAGLMIRSLYNLWNVDPGFNPRGVLTFYTSFSAARASNPEKIRQSLLELNGRLTSVPGVEFASLQIGGLPFLGDTTISFRADDDSQPQRTSEVRTARFYGVGVDHFRTMGIPILRGRSFTPKDALASPLVTVIDEELARTVFPGQDPIGKQIRVGLFDFDPKTRGDVRRPIEIVGVARHVKHTGLDSDDTAKVRMEYYFPIAQVPEVILPFAASAVAGIVRSETPTPALMSSIRKELASFDNTRAVANERLMTDAIAASLAGRRFSLIVLGAFALMALLLSMVGIYGVVSYLVMQRTGEIGVRVALGATPGDILYGVLREGGRLGAIGVAVGIATAAGLTRLMERLLFGTSPTDLATFSSAAILLFALIIAACYIPARRAVRIEPVAALRSE